MKLIFLDFDGVLNNDSSSYIFGFENPGRSHYNEACPDPICVRLIDILLLKSDADIVVSSSWRLGTDIDQLKDILKNEFGLNHYNRVIDKTDNFYDIGETRGHQIARWLYDNPQVTDFVVIDDGADALVPDWEKDHLVLVNAEYGFTVNDLYRAFEILGVERK